MKVDRARVVSASVFLTYKFQRDAVSPIKSSQLRNADKPRRAATSFAPATARSTGPMQTDRETEMPSPEQCSLRSGSVVEDPPSAPSSGSSRCSTPGLTPVPSVSPPLSIYASCGNDRSLSACRFTSARLGAQGAASPADGAAAATPLSPGSVLRISTTPPGERRLQNVFEPEVAQGLTGDGSITADEGPTSAEASVTAGADDETSRKGGIAMRGWLHKRRDHLPGTLRRFFVLRGWELSYFLSEVDALPRKVYDLRGGSLAVGTANESEPWSLERSLLAGLDPWSHSPNTSAAPDTTPFITITLSPGPRTPSGPLLRTPRGRAASGEVVAVAADSDKQLFEWLQALTAAAAIGRLPSPRPPPRPSPLRATPRAAVLAGLPPPREPAPAATDAHSSSARRHDISHSGWAGWSARLPVAAAQTPIRTWAAELHSPSPATAARTARPGAGDGASTPPSPGLPLRSRSSPSPTPSGMGEEGWGVVRALHVAMALQGRTPEHRYSPLPPRGARPARAHSVTAARAGRPGWRRPSGARRARPSRRRS
jgi:hypothetical protein